jgi:hypothetical protein
MPDVRFRDGYGLDFGAWEAILREISRYHVRMGASIVEFWRGVAEIHISTALAASNALENPPSRKRRFTVVQGGKRSSKAT